MYSPYGGSRSTAVWIVDRYIYGESETHDRSLVEAFQDYASDIGEPLPLSPEIKLFCHLLCTWHAPMYLACTEVYGVSNLAQRRGTVYSPGFCQDTMTFGFFVKKGRPARRKRHEGERRNYSQWEGVELDDGQPPVRRTINGLSTSVGASAAARGARSGGTRTFTVGQRGGIARPAAAVTAAVASIRRRRDDKKLISRYRPESGISISSGRADIKASGVYFREALEVNSILTDYILSLEAAG
ncbi:hypothetical protein QBC39DRAFT_335553 [Podospora conica]|nr:hypothetical protein QBC39DRAFT_335553 [Schizothecium conicum]